MTPQLVQVGKPYYDDGGIPPEGVRYDFRGGQHCLDMVLPTLTSDEILAFRKSTVSFALGVARSHAGMVIFLLFEIPGITAWSDCPFSIHLVDPEIRQLPSGTGNLGDEPHALLQMSLVDADDGIVKALRALTFSPAFTARLHLAIRAQAAYPRLEKGAYLRYIDDLYRVYPLTNDMLRDESFIIARCTGGD